MGRAPCCDKASVKKGPWSPEEDAKLKEFIDKYGTGGNWIALPQKAGLKRCGKSCRLRWLNYLRPNIKHGEFSDDEDRIICTLYASIGSRWSIIAAQLPGRTDNDIKNYWNTKLKKKLLAMVPSSLTHKKPPFFPTPPIPNSIYDLRTTKDFTAASYNYNYNTPPLMNNYSLSSTLPEQQLPNNNNNYSSLLGFQSQDISPMHYGGTGTRMLMFGGEASTTATCSSSDGSCISYGKEIRQEDHIALVGNHPAASGFDQDKNHSFIIDYGNNNSGTWTDQQKQYNCINTPLQDELEEVKQLVMSSSYLMLNDDENKTHETGMYYNYY